MPESVLTPAPVSTSQRRSNQSVIDDLDQLLHGVEVAGGRGDGEGATDRGVLHLGTPGAVLVPDVQLAAEDLPPVLAGLEGPSLRDRLRGRLGGEEADVREARI